MEPLNTDSQTGWFGSLDPRSWIPIRNADGLAYRVAGVAEDITGQKRAETELRIFPALDRSAGI